MGVQLQGRFPSLLGPQVWDAIRGTLRCSSEEIISQASAARRFPRQRWGVGRLYPKPAQLHTH